MKRFKYLTVLDFEQGDVCQYSLGYGHLENNLKYGLDDEDIELRLTELGHNLTNCEWMIHKNEPKIYKVITI